MTPANGETIFEFEGRPFTAVLNMAAILWFERETKTSLLEFLASLEKGESAPPLGLTTCLLRALLLKHHPDLDIDADVLPMVLNAEVQKAVGLTVNAGLATVAGGRRGNPPAPAKVSTGTKPSRARSKRG